MVERAVTAAAINLKRPATALLAFLVRWLVPSSPFVVLKLSQSAGFDVRAMTGLIAA